MKNKNKIFVCLVCHRVFQDKQQLIKHRLVHGLMKLVSTRLTRKTVLVLSRKEIQPRLCLQRCSENLQDLRHCNSRSNINLAKIDLRKHKLSKRTKYLLNPAKPDKSCRVGNQVYENFLKKEEVTDEMPLSPPSKPQSEYHNNKQDINTESVIKLEEIIEVNEIVQNDECNFTQDKNDTSMPTIFTVQTATATDVQQVQGDKSSKPGADSNSNPMGMQYMHGTNTNRVISILTEDISCLNKERSYSHEEVLHEMDGDKDQRVLRKRPSPKIQTYTEDSICEDEEINSSGDDNKKDSDFTTNEESESDSDSTNSTEESEPASRHFASQEFKQRQNFTTNTVKQKLGQIDKAYINITPLHSVGTYQKYTNQFIKAIAKSTSLNINVLKLRTNRAGHVGKNLAVIPIGSKSVELSSKSDSDNNSSYNCQLKKIKIKTTDLAGIWPKTLKTYQKKVKATSITNLEISKSGPDSQDIPINSESQAIENLPAIAVVTDAFQIVEKASQFVVANQYQIIGKLLEHVRCQTNEMTRERNCKIQYKEKCNPSTSISNLLDGIEETDVTSNSKSSTKASVISTIKTCQETTKAKNKEGSISGKPESEISQALQEVTTEESSKRSPKHQPKCQHLTSEKISEQWRSPWSSSDETEDENEDSVLTTKKTNAKTIPKNTTISKIFTCKQCSKEFTTSNRLNTHLSHHFYINSGRFKCKLCNKWFVSKSGLKNHEYSHQQHKPYLCSICAKEFLIERSLLIHEQEFHQINNNLELFLCDICGKRCFSKTQLKIHKQRHKSTKEYLCSICGVALKTLHNLKDHMKIHTTGAKKHTCTKCSATFLRVKNLKDHQATHSNERPFQCSKCEDTFKTKSTLITHLKRHEPKPRPKKRFLCEICNIKFCDKAYFQKHIKTHDTSQWSKCFTCVICNEKFARPRYLKAHQVNCVASD